MRRSSHWGGSATLGVALLLFAHGAAAQGAYTIGGGLDPDDPNVAAQFADAVSDLVEAEYFVGVDPGEGNGTPLLLENTANLARSLEELGVPVGNLPVGTHEVSVRVKDDAGRWSNPLVRRFTMTTYTIAGGVDANDPNVGTSFAAPAQELMEAEYFVGADPGEGNGTPLMLENTANLARSLEELGVPVGNLPVGTHEVSVRVKDNAGRWSNPLVRRFTMTTYTIAGGVDANDPNVGTSFAAPAQELMEAEYFVGADPGEGNGTPLMLENTENLARSLEELGVPVGDLPLGTHEVSVRVKDEAGRWSNPLVRRFTMATYTIAGGVDANDPNVGTSFAEPAQELMEAEYFVGPDPGEGNGTPLLLENAANLARGLEELGVPVGDLPPGTHEVSVRVKDEGGRWSNPLVRRFTVSTYTIAGGADVENPEIAMLFSSPFTTVVEAEYFLGPDPGEGNGVPLAVEAGEDMSKALQDVALGLDLPSGTHEVSVRVRDEGGRWSTPLRRRFNLYSQEVIARQRAGSELVDLSFDLLYGPSPYTVTVLISSDGGQTWTVPTGSLTGDIGKRGGAGTRQGGGVACRGRLGRASFRKTCTSV